MVEISQNLHEQKTPSLNTAQPQKSKVDLTNGGGGATDENQRPDTEEMQLDPQTAAQYAEFEQRLFGVIGSNTNQEQEITDTDFIPIKTGTGLKLMKNGPKHILDAKEYEPIYTPQVNIFEECLRREAERVAHRENLMNRVIFDCGESVLKNPNEQQANQPPSTSTGQPPPTAPATSTTQTKEEIEKQQYEEMERRANDPNHCDNSEFLQPFYTRKTKKDYTLFFESRFESANLRRAIQVYEFEYDLILKPDWNTRLNCQWYYFRVSGVTAGRTYRFNIINLLKPDSLYNHGMRPLMYSVMDAKTLGRGWVRAGQNVCYYQNSLQRKTSGKYYTLTFTITFTNDNDMVYLAHSYPYSYSDLQRYLAKLEEDPKKRSRFKRKELCKSLAGNSIDCLMVTNFGSDVDELKKRKGIVLSSRVHPGETGASYMMKGIIDYLVGPSIGAKLLRDQFVFKIIPMINCDGVINGNTRCSLAAIDLNRVWQDPSPKLHPEVYHLKKLLIEFGKERDLMLYCDLHGHSRKKNIFMYGCGEKNDTRYRERIFPYLLEKAADVFNFADCAFSVQKSKESTARVVGWRELQILNCFTLECSFCGSDFGKFTDLHFNTDMLQAIGPKFCETIAEYSMLHPDRLKAIVVELEQIANNQPTEKEEKLKLQDEAKAATAGLIGAGLSKEAVLGIIQDDQDSCQDSDFSEDERNVPPATANPNDPAQKPGEESKQDATDKAADPKNAKVTGKENSSAGSGQPATVAGAATGATTAELEESKRAEPTDKKSAALETKKKASSTNNTSAKDTAKVSKTKKAK